VAGNVIREVGTFEKQSSFFFRKHQSNDHCHRNRISSLSAQTEAKTARTTIAGNLLFNGPRCDDPYEGFCPPTPSV